MTLPLHKNGAETKQGFLKKIIILEKSMKQYRKKPVVVTAYVATEPMVIHTLEGDMQAQKGDYIITGVNGEQYPCKPDIFHKTYEEMI